MQDIPDSRDDVSAEAQAGAAAAALLAEVDHRVKNNLQLVASMILLQHRRTESEPARRALKGVLDRMNAVATVHRRLFQGDPHRFEVADFLRDLAGDLAASAGRDDIQITLDLEPVTLPAGAAAAFALLASELLGNALRHAFAEGRPGRISVTLTDDGAVCTLTIADDGTGLNGAPTGFGLTVAGLLARQLHARLDVASDDSQAGVRATLKVPIQPDRAG